MIWNWFSIEGRTTRGLAAIKSGRTQKAQKLLQSAWDRLYWKRQAGHPDILNEGRALHGFLALTTGDGNVAETIKLCRLATSLGRDEDVFLDYLCRASLNFSREAGDEATDDLVTWSCRQDSRSSPELEAPAGLRLAAVLSPRSNGPDAKKKALLELLVQGSRLGNWPYIYRAEFARRENDWGRAARLLFAAGERGSENREKEHHFRNAARCFHLSGDFSLAQMALGKASAISPPGSVIDWKLTIRLAESGQTALRHAIAGLEKWPGAPELLAELRRLGKETGSWKDLIRAAENSYSCSCNVERKTASLELWCEAAIRSRHEEEITAVAEVVITAAEAGEACRARLQAWPLVFAICTSPRSARRVYECPAFNAAGSTADGSLLGLAMLAHLPPAGPEEQTRLYNWFEVSSAAFGRFGRGWSRVAFQIALAARSVSTAVALRILLRCELAMIANAFYLHTLATLSAALLDRNAESSQDREDCILTFIGAWSSLRVNEGALQSFALSRYSAYGTGRSTPAVSAVQASIDAELSATVARIKSRKYTPSDLHLFCEVEKEAAFAASSQGGFSVDAGGNPAVLGPLLSVSLGAQYTLRASIDRMRNGPGESDAIREMREIAALLGLDIPLPEQSSDANSRRKRDLSRLFSPLAEPAVKMAQQRFQEADQSLSIGPLARARSSAQVVFSLFLNAGEHTEWLETERRAMRVECQLEYSKSLVARAPIEFQAVSEAWSKALSLARDASLQSSTRQLIGAIAVGRSSLLFANRTKEERMADKADFRTKSARREEALVLLELAWDLASDERVQGSLTEYLNLRAVELANEEKFAAASDILARAIKIKPNARLAAENLTNVSLAHASRNLGAFSDAAGEYLLRVIASVRAADPGGSSDLLSKCAENIADRGSTPFFNHSGEALELGNFRESTDAMIWALRLSPDDETVLNGASALFMSLQQSISEGHTECEFLRGRLLHHFPAHLRDRLAAVDELMRALGRAG